MADIIDNTIDTIFNVAEAFDAFTANVTNIVEPLVQKAE